MPCRRGFISLSSSQEPLLFTAFAKEKWQPNQRITSHFSVSNIPLQSQQMILIFLSGTDAEKKYHKDLASNCFLRGWPGLFSPNSLR